MRIYLSGTDRHFLVEPLLFPVFKQLIKDWDESQDMEISDRFFYEEMKADYSVGCFREIVGYVEHVLARRKNGI